MLQKTQWTMAATALAIGACLALAPRPAQAQVRYHLSRGGVKTIYSGGIVQPTNTSPTTPATGIVIPPSSGTTSPATGIVIPSTSGITTPAVTPPPPAPVVTPPPPVVTPANTVTQSGFYGSYPAPSSLQSSPQGFSAGPSLLGDQRLPLGRLVDRVPPAIIGDSGPTVQKVMAHH
jgi:hypothetical protein